MEDWLKPREAGEAAQAAVVRAHRMKWAYNMWAKKGDTGSEGLALWKP